VNIEVKGKNLLLIKIDSHSPFLKKILREGLIWGTSKNSKKTFIKNIVKSSVDKQDFHEDVYFLYIMFI